MKEYALTWGDLPNHELVQEKSAEALVATGNESRIETVEDSQRSEGLNVEFVPNSIRKLMGLTLSSLILNKGRRYFGEKSGILILSEPPYTRPVRTEF
ncbi:MAG: hypothetical protein PF450_10975 [Bacteroidales bacterium]|jgi:hypothetical protein|nr:hypothetical protein [Bacteroidales bacterium]